MENENPAASTPRRVIHWDPALAGRGLPPGSDPSPPRNSDAPRAQRRRWGRWVLVLGLIFAVWLGWRIWLVVLQPAWQQQAAARAAADPALAPADAPLLDGFVSTARVGRVRAEAAAALAEVRQLPAEHPVLVRSLVDLDRAQAEGERRWREQQLEPAWQQFQHVMNLAAAHRSLADAQGESARLQEQFIDTLPGAELARRHDPEAYERSLAAAAVARGAEAEGRFREAALGFGRALEASQQLVAASAAWLEQRLLDGQRALGTGEGAAAAAAFSDVLSLRPDSAAALRGRERAAVAAEVFGWLHTGEAALVAGDLDAAVTAFQRARELDPASVAAQQGASRAAAVVRDRDYSALVALADAAVARGDWTEAVARWEQAERDHGERPQVAVRLAEVRDQAFRARVAAATARGWAAEHQRDWTAARAAYTEALDLDAAHQPALEGLVRTGEVVRAIIRFDRLLAEASALALRGDFASAVRSFNLAMASKPDYLPLSEQAFALKGELERQSIPVPIQFISDGSTHVTISGYALLGQFREKSETILPGNYVIRGRRRGHRDVALTLRVRAGEPLPPITVICTERVSSR